MSGYGKRIVRRPTRRASFACDRSKTGYTVYTRVQTDNRVGCVKNSCKMFVFRESCESEKKTNSKWCSARLPLTRDEPRRYPIAESGGFQRMINRLLIYKVNERSMHTPPNRISVS